MGNKKKIILYIYIKQQVETTPRFQKNNVFNIKLIIIIYIMKLLNQINYFFYFSGEKKQL